MLYEMDDEYTGEADLMNLESYSRIAYYLSEFGIRKPWPRREQGNKINTINKPSWMGA